MAEQRLDKILASTGLYSRSEAKRLIRGGGVAVDGVVSRDPEGKADPARAVITAAGRPLCWRSETWVMLNKPAGLLSATTDSRQQTVLDLLTPELRRLRLSPVGRLDKDTEGLLLLTDDGVTAHELLSPRHHVDKVYHAVVAGRLTEEDCAAFRAGMTLGDGLRCLPAELRILREGESSEALVTLREGKFHQVKRMLAARGKPVTRLKRLSMGNLTLDPTLLPGEYRLLSPAETAELKKCSKTVEE